MDLDEFARQYKAIVGDTYDEPNETPESYKAVQEEYENHLLDDVDDELSFEFDEEEEYSRHNFHEHSISKKKTRSLMDKEREKKKKNFTRDSVRSHNWDD